MTADQEAEILTRVGVACCGGRSGKSDQQRQRYVARVKRAHAAAASA